MAVPKKRMSNSKTAMRRAQWDKMTAPTLSTCPNCREALRPHRICGNCGHYAGKEIIAGLQPDAAASSES